VTRIVGVHGIGNLRDGEAPGKAALRIGAEWTDWLDWPGADLRVAYYAHHLNRGHGPGGAEALEAGEQELLLGWVEQLRGVPAPRQEPLTARARQAAGWLSQRYGGAAQQFALEFCREAYTYLSDVDSSRRLSARREVATLIGEHRPRVVLAHSLGSVVAFEALHTYPRLSVDLLVTLGSPLAMAGTVLERLAVPHARPAGVRQWVNVADVGDLAAIPAGGVARAFAGVTADQEVTISKTDFHTVRNYLRCPEVADLLASLTLSS
jgi:pimeloyl-ACP methyl ester carboxylesterase